MTLSGRRVIAGIIGQDEVILEQGKPQYNVTGTLIKRGNWAQRKWNTGRMSKLAASSHGSTRSQQSGVVISSAFRENMALSVPWSGPFTLQNSETNLCCLSHPVYGPLSQQLQKTNKPSILLLRTSPPQRSLTSRSQSTSLKTQVFHFLFEVKLSVLAKSRVLSINVDGLLPFSFSKQGIGLNHELLHSIMKIKVPTPLPHFSIA